MKCCRVFYLILLLLFTACATCAILFPQYRRTSESNSNSTDTVYFWYRQSTASIAGVPSIVIGRTYSYNLLCQQGQVYYTVTAALSVAAAAFLGASTLFTACWINSRTEDGLIVTSVFMTFMGLACAAVTVALTAYTYVTTVCQGELTEMKAAKDNGFNLVEGFYLICIAAGGSLICFIFGFGLCCASVCCGGDDKNDDDYE
ncbi:hypothetical protein NESM_000721200 [Novymonas esmeraldas]|uniref:Uncharacterized protein n=1 Tax=Novymonas esmeraldas TaxID=1808958 RepID=A0AAW0EVD7_9TRYP